MFFSSITYRLFGFISLKFLTEVVLVTFLILLFGEILPKVYTNRNSRSFAQLMAVPLKVIDVLFTPLSMPMRWISISLHEKLGKQKSTLSIDHLSQALELTSEGDTTKEDHKSGQVRGTGGNTHTKQGGLTKWGQ